MRRAALAAACLVAASAATVAEESPIEHLRREFIACGYGAILDEFVASRTGTMAVERALAACQSEENAMFSTLSVMLSSVGRPDQGALAARRLTDDFRLRLKRTLMNTLNEMIAESAKRR